MKHNGIVRSTAEVVQPVEITPTRVYVRSDIKPVEITEPEESVFSGWEYSEIEMELYEYLSELQKTNSELQTSMELLTQGV